MATWDEFEKWLADHGIEAKWCDRVELVLGSEGSRPEIAVWLKVRQLAHKDGQPVYDRTKNEVIWEEAAVPAVYFPAVSGPTGSREKPVGWVPR